MAAIPPHFFTLADPAIVQALRDKLQGFTPKVMIVLGSGLGSLASQVHDPIVIPFGEIGLPDTSVEGHAGQLLAGMLNGVPVLMQQGRIHLYEGQPIGRVVEAVRVAQAVGVTHLVVTNAAGGINDTLAPGDLMALTDHINFTGMHPLIGVVPPHFVDMANAYDAASRDAFIAAGKRLGHHVQQGVYVGFTGPTFETPAEIAMCRTWQAHAVGMSTVNEVIAARALGLTVFGCSLITNVHRVGGSPTNHEEVLVEGQAAGPKLAAIIHEWLPEFVAQGAE